MIDENKIRRRDALRSIGAAVRTLSLMALPGLWMAREAYAQQKVAKEPVQYQDTPKNNQKCLECLHFVSPNACKLVKGEISPQGWCTIYVLKQS
jgi:hypothetical protein